MPSDTPQSPPSTSSLDVARRILAREGVSGGADDSEALQRVCIRMMNTLRDSLGEAGCTALLARGLTRTEGAHPALRQVRRWHEDAIYLDGVAAGSEVYGIAAVTVAIEALFAALLDVLTQLIGADMAMRLIDHDGRQPGTSGEGGTP
jgi:hypothetical protein